jgi:hypothetical protein
MYQRDGGVEHSFIHENSNNLGISNAQVLNDHIIDSLRQNPASKHKFHNLGISNHQSLGRYTSSTLHQNLKAQSSRLNLTSNTTAPKHPTAASRSCSPSSP